MKTVLLSLLSLACTSCARPNGNTIVMQRDSAGREESLPPVYTEVKQRIHDQRHVFARTYGLGKALSAKEQALLTDFWVTSISKDLFDHWQYTPWDFNGATTVPGEGAIACGYFVSTLLKDMDCKVSRRKLATCTSYEMMRTLVPGQKVKNLSSLSDHGFNDTLSRMGKGVYVIGLDVHTGFIVVDELGNWFIHSSYIGREGVIKEPVTSSAALKSSLTRWLVSLTGDRDFLYRWLKG